MLALSLPALVWAQGSLYDRAMEHYQRGEHGPALELLLQARQQRDVPELSLWIGWCQLRLQNVEEAQRAFERVLQAQPGHPEALSGLGYVALRSNLLEKAEGYFRQALAAKTDHLDALTGLALALFRSHRLTAAREMAERALALDPKNATALDLKERLLLEEEPEAPYPARSPLRRPEALQCDYRAGKHYFEVGEQRKPVFLQGVNLGPALPGRHPSQFPQSRQVYREWLEQMVDMGCNVVRVYTILPPGFYQAFWDYHQQPGRPPLWLVHGVWAEEPPAGNYLDADYDHEFRQEIEQVVDLLHGQRDLERRPGHAWGSYTADVSPWVLAFLLGREWEPYTVEAFNRRYPGLRFQGTYLRSAPQASPMEAHMAALCDHLIDYEMKRYHAQRPVSFTNWPTLDPLHHPSEATRAETSAILAARGEYNPVRSREYDNDAESISVANLIEQPAFQAGLYASYHAYPYYPDFMLHRPGRYASYLQDLKAFYGERPVLIAEYGVPSSRGNCHLQPDGMHHGGHSEAGQGEVDAELTRQIWQQGCAGAIVFAWIDEWFKKNWLVIDREIPLERNRLWLNYLDAEQNYGMLAMRPGERGRYSLQGLDSEWTGPPLAERFWCDSDEGFLYVRWDLDRPLGEAPVQIGINTVDKEGGEHLLPALDGEGPVEVEPGLEFLLTFDEQQGQLKVARDYRPYVEVAGPPSLGSALVANPQMLPRARREGAFEPLLVEGNRARLGRDGRTYPALRQDWGRLLKGCLGGDAASRDSRADWNYQPANRRLEVRLPWGLLSVTDPSSRRVIYEPWEASSIDTTVTPGFTFVLRQRGGAPRTTPLYTWAGWEQPRYHGEVKQAFRAMQAMFQELGGRPR